MSRIGIVAEAPREKRVSATPTTVPKLIALGYDVVVEAGSGAGSFWLYGLEVDMAGDLQHHIETFLIEPL